MVTPLSLQDGLNNFLKEKVASICKLKSQSMDGKEIFKHPQVFSGWILPKSISSDENENDCHEYPYIATRIANIGNINKLRASIATIKILYGVYCPGIYDSEDKLINDSSGYRDIWNLIETTRQNLFEHLTIDNKYRIVDDYFEAEMPDEQPYPYWQGWAVTKWHVPYPLPKLTF